MGCSPLLTTLDESTYEDAVALAERFDDWEVPARGEAAGEGPASWLEKILSKL